MKIKHFSSLAIASIISFTAVGASTLIQQPAAADPCAAVTSVDPCAANPCAAVDPCAAVNPCAAADPCAANPCAAADPCAANPCAAADPCAANPCAAADPCAANPCAAADPCAAAADPCAADPCAADPCAAAADPCAAAANPFAADSASIPAVYSDPATDKDLAIRGYDPVAYFTEEAPVKGDSQYTHEWNGVTWQFSSEQNQQLFASNPEAYAPQYGGYCAKAVSEGGLASTVPEAWSIVDGKLYLNYSPEVQQKWQANIPGRIAAADAQWPAILTSSNSVWYDSVGSVQF